MREKILTALVFIVWNIVKYAVKYNTSRIGESQGRTRIEIIEDDSILIYVVLNTINAVYVQLNKLHNKFKFELK